MPVDHKHKQYRKLLPVWRRCRAILGGSWEAKDSAVVEDILPRLSGHVNNQAAYDQYVAHAHFFPGAARAREGFVGLLNEDKAEVEAPETMKVFLDDVVGSGAPVTAQEFVARVVCEMVDVWRFGVLTNWPERPPGAPRPSVAEAEQRRLRPRWKLYKAEDIIDWHEVEVGGRNVLAYIVLHEQREEPAPTERDEFAWREVEQWRILDRAIPPPETPVDMMPPVPLEDGRVYRSRTYRKAEDGSTDGFTLVATAWPRMNGRFLAEIPFDCTPLDKPPLADAVEVNCGHFRNSAAHEHGLLFVANPMAYLFGYDADQEEETPEGAVPVRKTIRWKFGSSEMLVLKNSAARAGVLSAKADDLSGTMKAMQEKREELALVVGRLLATEKKAAEAAHTEELRRQGDKGVLSRLAQVVSEVLTRSMVRARDWMGATGDVAIRVSTEFFDQGFTPEEANTIAELWLKYGLLAKSDVRKVLRRGGMIERDRTDEDIDAEIAEEPIPSIPPPPGDNEGGEGDSGGDDV